MIVESHCFDEGKEEILAEVHARLNPCVICSRTKGREQFQKFVEKMNSVDVPVQKGLP